MKRFIMCFILSCLYCFCLPIPSFALEDNEINSFSELKRWFNSHPNGGDISLGADIFINDAYYYLIENPVTINTNGHTIYVQDKFIIETYNPQPPLTIQGSANENGLLHILKGGYCEISNTNIYAPTNENAIVQEEESILLANGNHITGNTQYAQYPSIISNQFYSPNIIPYLPLKENEELTLQYLPQDDNIRVNYQGQFNLLRDIPLIWNIDEYPNRKPYQYYLYHAQYQIDLLEINHQTFLKEDIRYYASPVAHVISTAGGYCITNVEKKWNEYSNQYLYNTYLKYKNPLETATLYYRLSPNDDWIEQESEFFPMGSYGILSFYDDSYSYIEFYVEATINGEKYNSNVAVMDNDILTFSDFEGGRGGGIDITPDNDHENKPDDNLQNVPDNNQQNISDNNSKDDVNPITDNNFNENTQNLPKDDSTTDTEDSNKETSIPSTIKSSLTPKASQSPLNNKRNAETDKKEILSTTKENVSSQQPVQTIKETTQLTTTNHTFIYQMIIGCLCLITIYILTSIISYKYRKNIH